MHAAGIVPDHAADGASAVGSGIGTEGELVLLGGGAQMIEDYARLNAGNALVRIELHNLRHILREIKNDSDIAALTCERGPSAATE